MLRHKRVQTIVVVTLLLISPAFLSSVKTRESQREGDKTPVDRWEYLVVANANRTNFQPTGNPRMRKEEMGGFGHEAFVLEQHLDNLGAKGWELVAVSGNPLDPVFYFKRPKQLRERE